MNSTHVEDRARQLAQGLKQAGLRLTPQRLSICRALAERKDHPTAQALYETLQKSMPTLSQATVYNTLEALVELGLIQDLGEAGDGATHYDIDPRPHINLVCTRCHRIVDLKEPALDGLAQRAAARSGYQVLGARIVYYGLCPECQHTTQ